MKAVRITSNRNESKIKLNLDSGVEYRLWLEANVPLNPSSDCWIFLLLPACMKLNEDLEISDTISSTAVAAFYKAQEELLIAHPHLNKITLKYEGDLNEANPASSRTTGSFFSGGLDSTYTAESIKEIQTLVGIWGFDISLKRVDHWNLSKELLEKYAQQTSKDLILVKTNLRELSNGLLSWGADYHGTALSGVANALSNHLKKVYVSATQIEETKSWGQFPSLSLKHLEPTTKN